jgi:B12-binding domain/radical SAM domain protein
MVRNTDYLAIRLTKSNRLSFPVLLNLLESARLDRKFNILLIENFLDLQKFVGKNPSGLLLYSFMTSNLPQILYELAWITKKRNPSIGLVAGGPHTTGDPLSSLKLGFDFALPGAGESIFIKFLRKFLERELPDIPTIFHGSDIKSIDESLPFSKYLSVSPPLEITRGCYWNCLFCQASCQKTIHRSMDSIKNYYERLRRKNHQRRVNFISPSAFEFAAENPRQVNYQAINDLLDYCKSSGTTYLEYGIFPSETRPNTFKEDLVALIKKYCSNGIITIGGQTGSDRMLKIVKRGHTIDDIENACEMACRFNLRPIVDFIFGFPDEKNFDRYQTLKFIKKLAVRYRAKHQVHYFLPLAGTIYQDSHPTPMDYKSIDILKEYEENGIVAGWWRKALLLSKQLVEIRDNLAELEIEYQQDHTLT